MLGWKGPDHLNELEVNGKSPFSLLLLMLDTSITVFANHQLSIPDEVSPIIRRRINEWVFNAGRFT